MFVNLFELLGLLLLAGVVAVVAILVVMTIGVFAKGAIAVLFENKNKK